MNTQANERPSGGGGGGGLQTKPRVSLPLSNEIAAVFVGRSLTHPDTTPEKRAKVEEQLASFEKFEVVYQQNTADEMNIVVPYFPEYDAEMVRMTKEELEQIAGGEFFVVVGAIGGFFATIGSALGVGSFAAVTTTVAGVGVIATGGIATASAIAAGLAASALVVGASLAATAVVGSAIGVGIAAAAGAFGGGGGGGDVGIGLAS